MATNRELTHFAGKPIGEMDFREDYPTPKLIVWPEDFEKDFTDFTFGFISEEGTSEP